MKRTPDKLTTFRNKFLILLIDISLLGHYNCQVRTFVRTSIRPFVRPSSKLKNQLIVYTTHIPLELNENNKKLNDSNYSAWLQRNCFRNPPPVFFSCTGGSIEWSITLLQTNTMFLIHFNICLFVLIFVCLSSNFCFY